MQAIIDKIAGECVAVRVRMVNRAITNIYDDALRPLGLKASQLNILIVTAIPMTASPKNTGSVSGHSGPGGAGHRRRCW